VITFVLASLICIIAPGPDTLTILSLGLSRGRSTATYFGAGCAIGCASHTLWAVLGVSAAIAASPVAFTVFKLCGAAYLGYLGVLMLGSKGEGFLSPPSKTGTIPGGAPSRFFFRGLLSNATNPKAALFFLAFLPQFVDRSRNVPLQIVTLGVVFIGLGLVVFSSLAAFAGQIGNWLRTRPTISRRLDFATGSLFLILAARLALARQ